MIKFFRKIRQNLVSENNFRKYLLYALGEIILVVIGILIALQINDWNESVKNDNREVYLLTELHKEFEMDSTILSTRAMLTDWKVKDGKMIKSFLEGKTDLETDSLISFAFYNGKFLLFESHTPTYDEIISSGNLSLIKNEELKKLIALFKNSIQLNNSFLFAESRKFKENYNAHLYKYFDAEIMTYIWKKHGRHKSRVKQIKNLNKFNIDVEGFKNDPHSLYHVSTVIGVDAELNFQYSERLNVRLSEILQAIRTELNLLKQ